MPDIAPTNTRVHESLNPFKGPTFNGKVMGKDVGEILKEYEKAEETKVNSIKEDIDIVNKTAEKLSTLQSKVTDIKTSLSQLFGEGLGASASGAFATREAVLVSGNSNVLDAYVSNDANVGDISVLVKQLASKDAVSAVGFVADLNQALGWTGSFDVGTTGQNSAGQVVHNTTTINLDVAMSLNDIMDAINNQAGTNHLSAEVTTFPGQYVLSLQGNSYAETITVDTANLNVQGGDATILPASSQKTVQDLSAIVQFRGINRDILYSSNVIPAGAQVEGVSFTLQQADPNTPVTIRIQNSQNTAVAAINTFVESYNALQDYLVTDDSYKGDARNAVNHLGLTLSNVAQGVTQGTLNNLRSLGVNLGSNGKLTIDTPTLVNTLDTKFDQVAQVFGFEQTSTNSSFIMMNRPTTLNQDMLTTGVNITLTKAMDGSLSATMALNGQNYNAVLGQPNQGTVTITADPNSPLAGMSFLSVGLDSLANGSAKATHISMSSGVADQLLTYLNPLLDTDPKKGLFALELQNLVGNKLDENVVGEKQLLEKKLSTQKESSAINIQKQMMAFQKLQIVNQRLEMQKNAIDTMVKYTAKS